jgi:glycosyltransferase involved in cell wall biosynthesis
MNNHKPQVSVVIAVRNRGDYLREALTSLINQTISDWECIIVDDHSTEDINAAVSSVNDARFRLVTNTGKGGISNSRNLGNSLARAPWIAVADSDDINLPRRLEVSLDYSNKNPELDVVYSTMYSFITGNAVLKNWNHARPYDRDTLYEHTIIPHPTAMYRTSVVIPIGYNESLSSAVDYDLWLSLADKHARFGFIEEPLVLYRRHEDQVRGTNEGKKKQDSNADLARANHAPYRYL